MKLLIYFIAIIMLSSASVALADDVYQAPEIFIAETYHGAAPASSTLAISSPLQQKIKSIMGPSYTLQTIKYWNSNGTTTWILEDIGKFKPITAGYVITPDGTISRVKVLIYRESHGWEVKHDFFTRQFTGAGLKNEKKLDQTIDGISGATLSVNALKRMGTLALLLHKEVRGIHEN